MNKKASVAKVVALAVVPLSLAAVVSNVARQRRDERAAIATRHLLNAISSSMGLQLSTSKLEKLIAEGANVNVRADDESTPLHHAPPPPATDCSILIDNGANVNARDRHGITPLMIAAAGAEVETVRLLLSRGAEPNLKAGLPSDSSPQYTALSRVRDNMREVSQASPASKQQPDIIQRNKRYGQIIQLLKAAGARE